jgi:hypothetical protein
MQATIKSGNELTEAVPTPQPFPLLKTRLTLSDGGLR